MRQQPWFGRVLALALLLSLLVGCGGAASPDSAANGFINGAGATFPAPLYDRWIGAYRREHREYKINYQAMGSGTGIKQITAKTVDFGATDAPMNEEELAKAPGILHVPTVLGAVVLAYNLPDYNEELRLTPATLSAVLKGEITRWNDPRLVADNPALAQVGLEIAVAYRSDGSGTTAVFTEYLAKVDPTWESAVGVGKAVKWPRGLGGKGNDGVASLIQQTPGAIGYIEFSYSELAKLKAATLKNAAGNWVKPSLQATTSAAAGITENLTESITNAPQPDAYPIASMTYVLVYQDPPDSARTAVVTDWLRWSLQNGDDLALEMFYAPLPPAVKERALGVLDQVKTQ